MTESKGGDGTVGKALDVLDLIASFNRPVRFAELQGKSPFPKATLYRLIQTLTHQNMLAQDPDTGAYSPGIRLVRLAHAAWQQSSLAPIARPHIDDLSRQAGQTIHLAQLDGGQVLYVDKRNAREPVDMFSQAGKVGPGYCTGVGKAMLAFLTETELEAVLARQSFHRFTPSTLTTKDALWTEFEEIRASGYAFDREEHEAGIICIAAPILSNGGRVIGGLSITGTLLKTTLAELESFAPLLLQTAQKIAEDAESWRFPGQQTANR
ncbi:IclR family transcriptional regulator [Roseibium litorale]|uniref:IclR family transcriptional regulator n=1 Tax=Roseibium litorale TaxID=2803841 RepID=A0ABR9CI37_9HYPH|nr:IclR family transcriptional regulator [Roseibium litorale]MBD8890035.1 IclR family transcriptional regulator [Roseibium litorale]